MPPYVEVPDSVLAVDKPVRSFDHKQTRDNIKFHHHGQSGVDGVFAGVITPTQLTANQNDYNPTGLSTASTIRVSSDKVVAITGLQQGLEGQVKVIMNVGSFTINFPAENTGSSAANRFANGFSLLAGRMVAFIYDSVASRWRTESAGPEVVSGDIPINLIKVGGINFAQASTAYLRTISHAADATEANNDFYVYKPFTMRELRAWAGAAVPASNSVVFTVRKNGADTVLTCTIGAGQQKAADISNSVDFGWGDRFSIKVVSSATAGTNDYNATIRACEPNTEIGHPGIFLKGSQSTTTRFLCELGGNLDQGGVDPGRSFPVGRCLISDFIMTMGGADAGATERIRRNNAFLGFITNSETQDAFDSPPRIFAQEGDVFAVTNETAATSLAGGMLYFQSIDQTKYDPCYMCFMDGGIAANQTHFLGGYGGAGGNFTVEAEAQINMPKCRVRNMRGTVNVVPTLGQTLTVTMRKNGVDTGLAITFTNAGGTIASDFVDEISFDAGDLMSFQAVNSVTSNVGDVTVSVEGFL